MAHGKHHADYCKACHDEQLAAATRRAENAEARAARLTKTLRVVARPGPEHADADAKMVSELASLERRATEGPWRVGKKTLPHERDSAGVAHDAVDVSVGSDSANVTVVGPVRMCGCGDNGAQIATISDFTLIAAVRNALPRLLALLKEQEASSEDLWLRIERLVIVREVLVNRLKKTGITDEELEDLTTFEDEAEGA